jgi:hypothetical protein
VRSDERAVPARLSRNAEDLDQRILFFFLWTVFFLLAARILSTKFG